MLIPIHYCTKFECYLYNVTSKKTKEENVIMHSIWMQRTIYILILLKIISKSYQKKKSGRRHSHIRTKPK